MGCTETTFQGRIIEVNPDISKKVRDPYKLMYPEKVECTGVTLRDENQMLWFKLHHPIDKSYENMTAKISEIEHTVEDGVIHTTQRFYVDDKQVYKGSIIRGIKALLKYKF